MNKVIWKYDVPARDTFQLLLPEGAKVLSVGVQGGQPRLWVLVDRDAAPEARWFVVCATGERVIQDLGQFIGTFQLENGALIFHVFEQE